MVLIIDNYDSFTFNLFQFIGTLTEEVMVCRNDKLTVAEIKRLRPSHIILSPGPGFPKDAGICEEVLESARANTDFRRVPGASGDRRGIRRQSHTR